MNINCLNAKTYLTCNLLIGSNSIQVEDARVFDMPIDEFVYLGISDGYYEEVVLLYGGTISGNVLTVERAQAGTERRAFAAGSKVYTTVNKCAIVKTIAQEIVDSVNVSGTDIRPLDNLWTGTNTFNNDVVIRGTVIDKDPVDGNSNLLNIHSGIYALESNYSSLTGVAYGAGIGVYRTAGTNFTVGAQVAGLHSGAVGNSDTWGVAAEGVQLPGAYGASIGVEATARNSTSDNTSNKYGVYITFKNRWDYETAPVQGLGANQYNLNSQALRIDSNPRSTFNEFCGWNRGIVFGANSLDAAQSGALATGIDFSEIPTANLSRIRDWIRLRGTKGIEWNGDTVPYTSIKTLFELSLG